MAVTTGGATADNQNTGGQPYEDPDGAKSYVHTFSGEILSKWLTVPVL